MAGAFYFISYSRVDGEDFAVKLGDQLTAGPPIIGVWLDRRQLQPGIDWDEQLVEALRGCEGFLYVMTKDSVSPNSECKKEPDYALFSACRRVVQNGNTRTDRRGWGMARNSVQFQKGLSETRFDELYGSEDRCREAVFGWRWPHGFVCPGCGGQHHCVIKTRALYQCTSCPDARPR